MHALQYSKGFWTKQHISGYVPSTLFNNISIKLIQTKKHIIQLNNNISQFNKNNATQIQKIYKRKTKDNI